MAVIPAEKEIGEIEAPASTGLKTGFSASSISLRDALFWAAGAAAAFHIAYSSPRLSGFILAYLICLVQVARVGTGRQAFCIGLSIGLIIAASQLHCFWTIFGPSAIALWLALAFWIAMFVALARICLLRFRLGGAMLIPFIWTGLEYFRSELYYLRFSWLNVGYTFSESALLSIFRPVGMYGIGFIYATLAALFSCALSNRNWVVAGAVACLSLSPLILPSNKWTSSPGNQVRVAGVQLEFVSEAEVLAALDKLAKLVPDAELFMLSEYTLDGPVPEKMKQWCHEHQHYLLVGGKDPVPNSNFYDTAFVVGPTGEIIFSQGKSVPIQFFKDGLPAREQKLWESPWGKIGICVCYDLSYTRVTDRLIGLGAQALLVPTMDVVDWGKGEHELHARVAPVRAVEYGVPIFRVASSGISQFVNSRGHVLAQAGFPGQEQTLTGLLEFGTPGTLPFDRILAKLSVVISGMVLVWDLITSFLGPRRTTSASQANKAGSLFTLL